MKIKNIINQHRRDFTAIMKCEFCGHEEINKSGYDDRYYHDNVIPNMKCEECDKSTFSEGQNPDFRPTKYPERISDMKKLSILLAFIILLGCSGKTICPTYSPDTKVSGKYFKPTHK